MLSCVIVTLTNHKEKGYHPDNFIITVVSRGSHQRQAVFRKYLHPVSASRMADALGLLHLSLIDHLKQVSDTCCIATDLSHL